MTIKEFIERDNEKLQQLINKYPKQIPCNVVAEYVGCSPENVRAAVDGGSLGFHWRKPGRLTSGNCIPTSKFVRWMLNMEV